MAASKIKETSTSLRISPSTAKGLSKSQEQFNQLIVRIEKLRDEIQQEESKLNSLLKCAQEQILPAHEKIARTKIQIAVTLDNLALKLDFRKQQIDDIGLIIVDMLDQAAELTELSDEEKEVFDRWSVASFEEEVDERAAEENERMADLFEAMFGMRVDFDELKRDPSKVEQLKQKLEEQGAAEQNRGGGQGRRKAKAGKSKKQQLQEAEAELKARSVRTIYISLAKLIHPDMESDPNLRDAKEEEMKKLTAAYEQNDLATLLQMEMAWIYKQFNHLDSIAEEKLKLFIQVLRDQVKELEAEKASFMWNPRYRMVAEYAYGKQETGIRKIKKEAREIMGMVQEMEMLHRSFDVAHPKKRIAAFVSDYIKQMNAFQFNFY